MSCHSNDPNPPKTVSPLEMIRNVNVVYSDGKTHLHRAVEKGNAEEVAMLLRCGANVSIKNREDETAFQLALGLHKFDIALVLANHDHKYTDNSELRGICGDFLIKHSIVCSSTERVLSEEERIHYFVEFSRKLYQKCRASVAFRLLKEYLEVCDFTTGNWLRCLYSLLELPMMQKSFALARSHADSSSECLYILLHVLQQKKISRPDRTAMIRTWINLGIHINVKVVNVAVYLYGFGDEVEEMIFSGQSIECCCYCPLPLTTFVLALKKDVRPAIFFEVLIIRWYNSGLPTQIRFGEKVMPFHPKRVVLETLKFISVSKGCRQMLLEDFKRTELECDEVSEKVNKLPIIPNLVELSRNAVRRKLLQNRRIKAPYQFHQAVKNLDVPREVQDIIRFKRPIYV